MRRMWQRPKRWKAYDELVLTEPDEICQIRMAAVAGHNLRRLVDVQAGDAARGQALAQPLLDATPVDVMAMSNTTGLKHSPFLGLSVATIAMVH
jgi:hypothetical protein